MGLFAPWFLAGLLAVGVPLWIHLLRQHKNTPRPFASLMFFERRTQSSVKHRRLKHYALLALRLAVILLLALLFANPFIRRNPTAVSGRKLVVVAVDNSFSMRYGDHLQRAKRDALSTIAGVSGGDVAEVASVGDHVELLTQPVNDKAALQAAVQSIQPGDSTSSYAELSRFLRALPASTGLPVEAHFFSDLQRSAMPPSFTDLALADRIRLQLHPITDRNPVNWVVENVSAPDRVFGTAKPSIDATVAGLGTSAARRTVTLMVNGKVVETKPVDVPAGSRATVRFEKVDVPYGQNRGEVTIDGGDSLAADNHFNFSIERADPAKVLFIYDPHQSPAFFRAALEAGADSAFELDSLTPEQAANVNLSRYAYVALSGVGSLPASLESGLKLFANNGGGLLIALGPLSAGAGKVPVLGTRISGSEYYTRDGDRFQTASSVDATHPALDRANGFDGVKFYWAARVDPGADRVLARLGDGTPLLLEHHLGEGRVLILTSSFDNATNDLPLHALIVPFIERTSRYLEGGEARQSNVAVGTAIELRTGKDRGGAAAEVTGPDGKRALSLEQASTELAFPAAGEGFYDVRTAGGRHELVAVNADRRESDLTPVPEETLALWRGTSGAVPNAGMPGTVPEPVPLSLWKYVLIALLAVAAAESWLADRFTPAAREERVEIRKQAA